MKNLILIILVVISGLLYSQNAVQSQKEFNSGKTTTFSSKGLGKSNGLKIHFQYPKSWIAIEGKRPHIVQSFMHPENYISALIYVNKKEKEFSKSEIENILSTNYLKQGVPTSGNYIKSGNKLKIEGLKVASLEYTDSNKRVDRKIYSHTVSYNIIYKDYFIQIIFSATNKEGESNISVDSKFKNFEPLFYQMFNSIVIDNIWE